MSGATSSAGPCDQRHCDAQQHGARCFWDPPGRWTCNLQFVGLYFSRFFWCNPIFSSFLWCNPKFSGFFWVQSQIYHLGSYDILLGAIPSSLQAVSSSSRTTGTGQVFWRDAMGRREVFLWKTGW